MRQWIERFNVDVYNLQKDNNALKDQVLSLQSQLELATFWIQVVYLVFFPWLVVLTYQLWKFW